MGINRAQHVATAMQVEQEAISSRTGGNNPFGRYAASIDRCTLDVCRDWRRHLFHHGAHALHVGGFRHLLPDRLECLNRHLQLWTCHRYPPYSFFPWAAPTYNQAKGLSIRTRGHFTPLCLLGRWCSPAAELQYSVPTSLPATRP